MSSAMDQLYQQLILDHAKHPHAKGLDEGAAAVLDAAVPGMDLEEFEADADCWLHQEDPAYRKLLIKLIWDQFLARDDDGRIGVQHGARHAVVREGAANAHSEHVGP